MQLNSLRKMDPKASLVRYAVLALAALLLAGCASTPQYENPVERRSQARWDALIGKRFDEAYVYYSPGYRSAHSLNDFIVDMGTKRVRWESATYRDKHCEKDSCKVRFDLVFTVNKPAPGVSSYEGKSVSEETWVKLAGEWWYVPEK